MRNQTLQPRAARHARAPSRSRLRTTYSLMWVPFCFLSLATPVLAELPFAQRLSLRSSVGGSLMLSSDQRAWLGYSAPGLLSDLQLKFHASQLLAAHLGVAGGVFFSDIAHGVVLAPMLGGSLHWPLASVPTYLALSLGAAFTGDDMRPFARAVLGIDWALSAQLTAGPMLGLDLVQQQDGRQFSSDAIYAWVGVGLGFRPVRAAAAPVRKPASVQRSARDRGVVLPPPAADVIPEPGLPFELSREREPAAPSTAITRLIDEAVHVEHTELLAPVLFEFDSVELEPSSVAMLHEVARLLNNERSDIERLAVIAYSDAQGSQTYNLQLSQRRARHVRDWLVKHGVAPERLTVDARGSTEPVEEGEGADQQQNRRVVFRMLRAEPQR